MKIFLGLLYRRLPELGSEVLSFEVRQHLKKEGVAYRYRDAF